MLGGNKNERFQIDPRDIVLFPGILECDLRQPTTNRHQQNLANTKMDKKIVWKMILPWFCSWLQLPSTYSNVYWVKGEGGGRPPWDLSQHDSRRLLGFLLFGLCLLLFYVFLSFCVFVFLSFCVFVFCYFLSFCLFVSLSFCLFICWDLTQHDSQRLRRFPLLALIVFLLLLSLLLLHRLHLGDLGGGHRLKKTLPTLAGMA